MGAGSDAEPWLNAQGEVKWQPRLITLERRWKVAPYVHVWRAEPDPGWEPALYRHHWVAVAFAEREARRRMKRYFERMHDEEPGG